MDRNWPKSEDELEVKVVVIVENNLGGLKWPHKPWSSYKGTFGFNNPSQNKFRPLFSSFSSSLMLLIFTSKLTKNYAFKLLYTGILSKTQITRSTATMSGWIIAPSQSCKIKFLTRITLWQTNLLKFITGVFYGNGHGYCTRSLL